MSAGERTLLGLTFTVLGAACLGFVLTFAARIAGLAAGSARHGH